MAATALARASVESRYPTLLWNGKALMRYKITTSLLRVVVGNSVTSIWQTIPNSMETWGEVGNILLVDRKEAASFQIIAVREAATEIFHSNLGVWMKLRFNRATRCVSETTMMSIKDKLIGATLCGGLLFCYRGVHPSSSSDSAIIILVSFYVKELWTDDCIPVPSHLSSRCFQIVECVGNLFAVLHYKDNFVLIHIQLT